MTIELSADQNDYLAYQLYVASQSERIRKKRQRSRVVVPVFYLGIALFSIIGGRDVMSYIFFAFAILWYLLYPLWERGAYKRNFIQHIQENYKERFGKVATVQLDNDFILVKEDESESKIATKEIEEIVEIPTTIFIRLKGGQSFILPKDKIGDLEALRARLNEIATHVNVPYVTKENWKWR